MREHEERGCLDQEAPGVQTYTQVSGSPSVSSANFGLEGAARTWMLRTGGTSLLEAFAPHLGLDASVLAHVESVLILLLVFLIFVPITAIAVNPKSPLRSQG